MDYLFSSANPRIDPIYVVIAVVLALAARIVTDYYRRQDRITKVQSAAVVLLTAYIFLVFASTVFCRESKEYYSYELLPFWSYWEIFNGEQSLFWEDVLNIVMLFPIGILLPIVMETDMEKQGSRRVILIGFLISLVIELLQLIMKRGLFEFDDIFHNTIGVIIGCWLYGKLRILSNR